MTSTRDEQGPKDWPQLMQEWETHQDAPADAPPRLAFPCRDANPWDKAIRCEEPAGHAGAHRADAGLYEAERWDDACHWPGDSCDPCANPGRAAS